MIIHTKFQAKWITFGCATAKSHWAVMYSHPMIHQCFACISLKNHSINFIFWKYVLVDFRRIDIIIFFKKSCKKLYKQLLHFGCIISRWMTVPSTISLGHIDWELFKVIKDKSVTVPKAMKALAGKQKMPEDNGEE